MNTFEKAIWETERHLGAKLSTEDFQKVVMDAKRALMQNLPTSISFNIVNGEIFATHDLISPQSMDLTCALVFILRAYRLQQGLQ